MPAVENIIAWALTSGDRVMQMKHDMLEDSGAVIVREVSARVPALCAHASILNNMGRVSKLVLVGASIGARAPWPAYTTRRCCQTSGTIVALEQ